jgi:hypothetical protein
MCRSSYPPNNADAQKPGVQIDAAVESMLFGVETHVMDFLGGA